MQIYVMYLCKKFLTNPWPLIAKYLVYQFYCVGFSFRLSYPLMTQGLILCE